MQNLSGFLKIKLQLVQNSKNYVLTLKLKITYSINQCEKNQPNWTLIKKSYVLNKWQRSNLSTTYSTGSLQEKLLSL